MHDKIHRPGRAVLALSVAVMLLLGACGPAAADATPTVDVQAIYTFAFQTLAAQQATQLALTPPTGTPSPTSAATLPPPPSPLATLRVWQSHSQGRWRRRDHLRQRGVRFGRDHPGWNHHRARKEIR